MSEESKKYRDYYEYAPVMNMSVDPVTAKINECNWTLVEKLNYSSKEQIIGNTLDFIYHPSCHDEYKKAFKLFQATGVIKNHRLILKKMNGSPLNVLLNATAVRNADGKIVRSRSSCTDITDLVNTENIVGRYLKINKRLELAKNSAQIGVWEWDIIDDELTWDDQMYDLYGLNKQEFNGVVEAWKKVIHPHDKQRVQEEFREAIENVSNFDTAFRVIRPSGAIRHIKAHGLLTKNNNGVPITITGINYDITSRVEQEQELIQSNKELEQFAYVASHDLQAPLRHVISYIDVLNEEVSPADLNVEAQKAMSYISEGARKMKRLISDLLAFSRVGKSSLRFIQCELNAKLSDLKSVVSKELNEIDASIEVDVFPNIICDEDRVGQVFQNLVENSIKYRSKEKKLAIHIGVVEEAQNYKFFVKDNGQGILDQHKERIFNIFQRLHTGEDGQGSGIGLSICRKIIQLHNGKIWVESDGETGSTFYFTISKFLNSTVVNKSENQI